MRATPWIAAAAMTFLASGHARADEFWSSYENTLTSFLAGEPSPGDFYTKAAPKILGGIGGKWVQLSVLAPAIGDDAIVQKACNSIHFEAKQDSPFSFVFTRRSGRDASAALEFKYTLAYSNVFGVAVDPEALLEMFGLNGPEIRIDQKLQVLRNANRMVEVFRPSKDILVIKGLLAPAEIYGRCR
jgi:hypothetical protein